MTCTRGLSRDLTRDQCLLQSVSKSPKAFQNHQKLYHVVTGLFITTQFLSALRTLPILWIDLLNVLQRRQSTQHRRASWIVMTMLLNLTTLDITRIFGVVYGGLTGSPHIARNRVSQLIHVYGGSTGSPLLLQACIVRLCARTMSRVVIVM